MSGYRVGDNNLGGLQRQICANIFSKLKAKYIKMHTDLALVTSGGGMTCAYSAGGLLALKDLGITKPALTN